MVNKWQLVYLFYVKKYDKAFKYFIITVSLYTIFFISIILELYLKAEYIPKFVSLFRDS